MSAATFKAQYAKLNTAQKEAVDTIEGPVMVVAGPGTGKTQILALRIANILAKTDTPPEAVLALTFTEKATANMRERLVDLVGQAGWLVKVRTFHSFANEVIQSHPDMFERLIGAAPLTDGERLAAIEGILETGDVPRLRPLGRPDLYVKEIGGALDTLKREGVKPAEFKKLMKHESVSLDEKATESESNRIEKLVELAELYDSYQEYLTKTGRYDFADMLIEVSDALESDQDLLRSLQERYLYILVDEHQDTNGIQNTIVERIASFHERPNLFVVGDLQQAIYRFQGASLANFRDFEKRFPGVRVITLTDNYRSTKAVLESAAGIVVQEKALSPKAKHKDEPVQLYAFSSPTVQEFAIGEMIAERLEKGVPAREIAVLARTNMELRAFAETLERRSIPYQLGSDDQTLNDPHIRKILTIARAVRDVGESGPLLYALQIDLLGVDPLDAWTVAQASERGRQNAWIIMKSHAWRKKLPLIDPKSLERAAKKLTALATDVRNMPAPQALQKIVHALDIIPALAAKPDGERTLLRLHSLYDVVQDQLAGNPRALLTDFLDTLDLLERHNVALGASAAVPSDAVQLLTVHKAKGLEFDTVFVPNATASNWELKRGNVKLRLPASVWRVVKEVEDALGDDPAEDARRLVYVAITRAKRKAILCWPMARVDGKPLEPSRFVLAIPEKFTERPDTSVFESGFAEHGHERLLPRPKQSGRLKARIWEMAKSRPLSVTALNNYLECPWKYFYVNLLRIPEPTTPPAEYGKAAHAALEHFFRGYNSTEQVSKSDLLSRFSLELERSPLNERMRAQIEREGLRDLSGWFDATKNAWRRPLVVEESITVSLKSGPDITGKLDKVEFLNGTPKTKANVEVIDYKTKAWMSENAIRGKTKSDTGNEFRQLVFYRLLLESYRDASWNMVQGRIDFLKPKNGTYKSVALTVSSRDVRELKEQIRSMMSEIQKLSFWNSRCDKTDCKYCDWRPMMSV